MGLYGRAGAGGTTEFLLVLPMALAIVAPVAPVVALTLGTFDQLDHRSKNRFQGRKKT